MLQKEIKKIQSLVFPGKDARRIVLHLSLTIQHLKLLPNFLEDQLYFYQIISSLKSFKTLS